MSGFTPVLLLQTPGTLCRGPSRGALVYDGVEPEPLQRQSCDQGHAGEYVSTLQDTPISRCECRCTEVAACYLFMGLGSAGHRDHAHNYCRSDQHIYACRNVVLVYIKAAARCIPRTDNIACNEIQLTWRLWGFERLLPTRDRRRMWRVSVKPLHGVEIGWP